MSKLLSLILAAGLLVYPFATYPADYGSQTSQDQQGPPVAQKLVREGDFAIKLAQQLELGSPADEAAAEDMLTRAGIVPANGWISDYPVTPQIIGQLNDSIARATDQGKLKMSSDTAKKGLTELAVSMDLPLPADLSGNQTAAAEPAPNTTINNYYSDQGPPIVTYYPPPPDYLYLYDWVPFPVVWFGFGFPGFFICHTFTTVVTVSPFVIGPHHVHGAIVSNHVFDHRTGIVAFVDPVVRTGSGAVRPATVLRTGSGRTFSNVSEFSHARSMTGPRTGMQARTPAGSSGFRSPEARRSAGMIESRSIGAFRSRSQTNLARNFTPGRETSNSGRSLNTQGAPQRSFNAPMNGGLRRTAPPSIGTGRQAAPSRQMAPSQMNSGRQIISPRSFAGPATGHAPAMGHAPAIGRGFGGAIGGAGGGRAR